MEHNRQVKLSGFKPSLLTCVRHSAGRSPRTGRRKSSATRRVVSVGAKLKGRVEHMQNQVATSCRFRQARYFTSASQATCALVEAHSACATGQEFHQLRSPCGLPPENRLLSAPGWCPSITESALPPLEQGHHRRGAPAPPADRPGRCLCNSSFR